MREKGVVTSEFLDRLWWCYYSQSIHYPKEYRWDFWQQPGRLGWNHRGAGVLCHVGHTFDLRRIRVLPVFLSDVPTSRRKAWEDLSWGGEIAVCLSDKIYWRTPLRLAWPDPLSFDGPTVEGTTNVRTEVVVPGLDLALDLLLVFEGWLERPR